MNDYSNPNDETLNEDEIIDDVLDTMEGDYDFEDETSDGRNGETPDSEQNETVSNPNSLSLEEINSFLGKDFKDKESALKSFKDAQKHISKTGEKIKAVEKELSDAEILKQEVKQLKIDRFFDKNPQYESYRDIITSLGENPQDIVNQDSFKAIFEKARSYDEMNNNRSVIHSNPKLHNITNKSKKARDLVLKGKTQEDIDKGKEMAVQAVLEDLED